MTQIETEVNELHNHRPLKLFSQKSQTLSKLKLDFYLEFEKLMFKHKKYDAAAKYFVYFQRSLTVSLSAYRRYDVVLREYNEIRNEIKIDLPDSHQTVSDPYLNKGLLLMSGLIKQFNQYHLEVIRTLRVILEGNKHGSINTLLEVINTQQTLMKTIVEGNSDFPRRVVAFVELRTLLDIEKQISASFVTSIKNLDKKTENLHNKIRGDFVNLSNTMEAFKQDAHILRNNPKLWFLHKEIFAEKHKVLMKSALVTFQILDLMQTSGALTVIGKAGSAVSSELIAVVDGGIHATSMVCESLEIAVDGKIMGVMQTVKNKVLKRAA